MLSNDYYSYDSSGSDSCGLEKGSLIKGITFSAQLDHNYELNHSFKDFNQLLSLPMDPMFDFSDLDQMDFASAPTPLMSSCFADLNDIESDDLLDYNTRDDNSIDNIPVVDIPILDMNNNSSLELFVENVGNVIEIGVNNNTVNEFIANDSELSLHNSNDYGVISSVEESVPNKPNTRKRRPTDPIDESDDDEEEDEDEEELSSVQEFNVKRKSKVGRKPSKGQNKCMSKNAIAARENRERKKAYTETMEKRLRVAEDENKKMKTLINDLNKRYGDVYNENQYLRGVLENQSTISDLIKHMSKVKDIKLVGTQLMATKEDQKLATKEDQKLATIGDLKQRKSSRIASKSDISSQQKVHRFKGDIQSSGVCLHVDNNEVFLEFCAKCSQKHKRGK